jgi:hypothetical protein
MNQQSDTDGRDIRTNADTKLNSMVAMLCPEEAVVKWLLNLVHPADARAEAEMS